MVISREALATARSRVMKRPAVIDRPLRALKAQAKARVPQRFHAITHEAAKFGTIGVINLIVNFAVFNLLWLTVLRTGEVKAKAIATIVATTCAYFMNRHWTYKDRPKSALRREYSLFFFFNLVGLIIETSVVALAKYGFHLTHIVVLNLFTLLGIVLGTIFRFWAYRTHVFKADPAPLADGEVVLLEAAHLEPMHGVDDQEPEAAADSGAAVQGEAPEDLQDELTSLELEAMVQEQPSQSARQ